MASCAQKHCIAEQHIRFTWKVEKVCLDTFNVRLRLLKLFIGDLMFRTILILLSVFYSPFSLAVDCSVHLDLQSNEYVYGSQSAYSQNCRSNMRRENFKGLILTNDEIEYLNEKDLLSEKADDLLRLAVVKTYSVIDSSPGYGDILRDQILRTEYLTYQAQELVVNSRLFLLNQNNSDASREAIYAKEKLVLEIRKAHIRQNLFKLRDRGLEQYFISMGFSSDEAIERIENVTNPRELRSIINEAIDSIVVPSVGSGELASDITEIHSRINDYYLLDKITQIVLWNNRNRVGTPVHYDSSSDFSSILSKIEKINEFRAVHFYDRSSLVSVVRYKGLVVPPNNSPLWQNVSGRFLFSNFAAQTYNYGNGPVVLTQRDYDAFNFGLSFSALERNIISTFDVFWGDKELLTDLKWFKVKKGYSQFFEL